MIKISLDLGCGKEPKNPFEADKVFGVDFKENLDQNIKASDLAIGPIPYEGDTFDFVSAFDFIEHIPRVIYAPEKRFSFVELMDEIYRVLKPGGHFLSFTPAFPAIDAFSDPTHVNVITEKTFPIYFCNEVVARIYGFKGEFQLIGQKWHDWTSWPIAIGAGVENPGQTHLLTILKKPEP